MTRGFAIFWPMSIGDRIKRAREAKGVSQEALASEIGVSRPAVSQWEDGATEPRRAKLPQIAVALDVTVRWLQEGDEAEAGVGPMPVRGEIAAGVWREAIELDLAPIPTKPHPDYPAAAQYALLVRGTSMNKVASDSEYVIVVDTTLSGIAARPGDIVCVRRRRHDTIELSARLLVKSGDNLALDGISTDALYQKLIPLTGNGGGGEFEIFGIVVGQFSFVKRGPA